MKSFIPFNPSISLILLALLLQACGPLMPVSQATTTVVPISTVAVNSRFETFTPENITRLEQVNSLGVGQVVGVAASADQSKLAVYINREIKIYDAKTFEELQTIPAGKYTEAGDRPQDILLFSGDGGTLIFTNGSSISIWDLQTNERIRWFASLIPEWEVVNLELSPDGTRLMVTTLGGSGRCDGRDKNFALYDLYGALLFDQYGCPSYSSNHYKFVSSNLVYFSFSSIMTDKFPLRSYLVETQNGSVLESSAYNFDMDEKSRQEVMYDISPDGNILAYAVYGEGKPFTKLVSFTSRENLGTLDGYIEFLTDDGQVVWRERSFSSFPPEKEFVSEKCEIKNPGSYDRYRQIAINDNKLVLEITHFGKFESLDLLDLNTCQTVDRLSYPAADQVVFSPDSRWLATTDGFNAHVWDANTGNMHFSIPGVLTEGPNDIIQFNSDGTRFLVSTFGRDYIHPEQPYRNYTIHVFDANSGLLVQEIQPQTEFLYDIASSPDKDIFMAWDSAGMHFWNMESGNLLSTLPSGPYLFHTEDNQIWVVPQEKGNETTTKNIYLYDYKTGEIIRPFHTLSAEFVRGLYLSRDHKSLMVHLFSGWGNDKGNEISILDIETSDEVSVHILPWIGYDISVRDDLFAASDVHGLVYLQNFNSDVPDLTISACQKNRKVRDEYDEDDDFNNVVTMLINERILMTRCGADVLWDAGNGTLLSEISADYRMDELVLSPDQSLMAITSDDGIVRVWAVPKP
jgi:WD40 repeat protein